MKAVFTVLLLCVHFIKREKRKNIIIGLEATEIYSLLDTMKNSGFVNGFNVILRLKMIIQTENTQTQTFRNNFPYNPPTGTQSGLTFENSQTYMIIDLLECSVCPAVCFSRYRACIRREGCNCADSGSVSEMRRKVPHCRTQDANNEMWVGPRSNSSHFINRVPPEEAAYMFVKLQPVVTNVCSYQCKSTFD